ncbi:DUF6332 family protein [Streptomyces sp. ADMS]|uniref:DUF6332 family protein n=1 Tax=Streptomyces sp. ADMS TaxID=3071415 RepID=UPI00296E2C2D|nr:DUF6332 family protein [Streptomyces sp. ADMS]MDW4905732.1 DUF6332 family protein [Streptomyces sp. ADMS]
MDNYGGNTGQGRARDSQARRDAVTVEIGYALCSAAFLAAVTFGVVAGPAWVFTLSGTAQATLVASGATLGAVLFFVRVVSVLGRFSRENDGTGGDQPGLPDRTNPDS